MKKIAIEEHCQPQCFLDHFQSRKGYPRLESVADERGQKAWRWWSSAEEYRTWLAPACVDRMRDIGEGRLRDMDEAGIDMQVLSSPTFVDEQDAEEGADFARKVNDAVAAAIRKHPDRFAGFATLCLKDPKSAAVELERAVKHLAFKGTMIASHVHGEFLDAGRFRPFFEKAARLDVPVYIHPAFPPADRRKQYAGYHELTGAMWGFAAEAGLAAVRLICSGIFDEFPGLKIILGHMGEGLPFWMSRLDNRMQTPNLISPTNLELQAGADARPLADKLKKLPSQYIHDHFFITVSGVHSVPALHCARLALGADKILFAADYPMESNREAVRFMETAPIPDSDKEKIFHSNAERLLGLRSPQKSG